MCSLNTNNIIKKYRSGEVIKLCNTIKKNNKNDFEFYIYNYKIYKLDCG